ncbi:MAG: HdeD family acid-resistance protein [Christensenellaceae bacterium]|jgi:uncharacterized membrane protein HdeD (DUF308 family)
MKKRSGFGWGEFILGIIFIILGVYTIVNPSIALTTAVVAYGIVAVASGIVDIWLFIRLERRGGFAPGVMLVMGILDIIAGIILLFNVNIGVLAFSIAIPIWFIAHCIARLVNISAFRPLCSSGQYALVIILNILGIILGVMMFLNPITSMFSVGYLASIYLFVMGISSIVGAFSDVGAAK